MKKKVLLASALTILVCLSLIAGSTFALFTTGDNVSMIVGSATVKMTATISDVALTSFGRPCSNNTFENLGTATLTGNQLSLVNMSPGDAVTFKINLTNHSNITTQCKVYTSSSSTSNPSLAGALQTNYSCSKTNMAVNGGWVTLGVGESITVTVTITFPNGTPENDNKYQNTNVTTQFFVQAVQGNGVDANGNLITP